MKKTEDCITPFISDQDFIRTDIPMTKQEVRELSICRLHLAADSVMYDIGCGTGSVSVEAGRLSKKIRVFALDSNPAAVKLTEENVRKFGLENISVIEKCAPSGLEDLPPADSAFIGGSRGHLKEILQSLYKKNPSMRVVINAISLEALSQIQTSLKDFPVSNFELVQLSVTKAEKAGDYHLLKAQNPVFIFSFDFSGKGGL